MLDNIRNDLEFQGLYNSHKQYSTLIEPLTLSLLTASGVPF